MSAEILNVVAAGSPIHRDSFSSYAPEQEILLFFNNDLIVYRLTIGGHSSLRNGRSFSIFGNDRPLCSKNLAFEFRCRFIRVIIDLLGGNHNVAILVGLPIAG